MERGWNERAEGCELIRRVGRGGERDVILCCAGNKCKTIRESY